MSNTFTFTRIQLTNWRWSWPSMLLSGIVVPVLMSLGLGVYAQNLGGAAVEYAVIGGLSFSLLFELQGKIATNISFMKANGALDQLAATGAKRLQFVVGSFIAFSLLATPSLLITPVAVVKILGLSLSPSFTIIPALFFAGCAFLSAGMIIGALCSSLEQASSISLLLAITLLSLGPVAVPNELLPSWLQIVGEANPAVHISEAIRYGLFGGDGIPWVSIAYLVGATIVLLIGAVVSLPWRHKRE